MSTRLMVRAAGASGLALLAACGAPRQESRAPAQSSPSPTIRATPVAAIVPGDYWPSPVPCLKHPVNKEAAGDPRHDLTSYGLIVWCVDRITVDSERMVVQVRRELESGIVNKVELDYRGDEGNRNMYLVDDHGRRYDSVTTTGAAKTGGKLKEGSRLVGSFVFPAPAAGVRAFSFHDDDYHITLDGLRLDPATRVDPKRSESLHALLAGVDNVSLTESWQGYSPISPVKTRRTLLKSKDRWAGEASFSVRDRSKTLQVKPQPGAVEDFLEQLGQSPLVEGAYVPIITHTDDYPELSIELSGAGRRVVFRTQSQGEGHVPWAAEFGGGTWVVPSDVPARALDSLRKRLDDGADKVMKTLMDEAKNPEPRTPTESFGRPTEPRPRESYGPPAGRLEARGPERTSVRSSDQEMRNPSSKKMPEIAGTLELEVQPATISNNQPFTLRVFVNNTGSRPWKLKSVGLTIRRNAQSAPSLPVRLKATDVPSHSKALVVEASGRWEDAVTWVAYATIVTDNGDLATNSVVFIKNK